jgi:hypothetical protein
MKRSSRISSNLRTSVHHQLNMYALAATAGGVGILGVTHAAEAKIVYTPTSVSIVGPRGFYNLDLNHDGITDFTVFNTTNYNTDQAFWELGAKPAPGNAAIGTIAYRGFPVSLRALPRGARIGAGDRFYHTAGKMASFYVGGGGYSSHGNWVNVSNRYLGLKFQINGTIHYGWARLTVQVLTHPVRINALLTGYAYETTPNKAIAAGRTHGSGESRAKLPSPIPMAKPAQTHASLGLLAMGSSGLSIWRRKEQLAGAQ